MKLDLKIVKQDIHLSNNQNEKIRCIDNGIFKGVPLNNEEKTLRKFLEISIINIHMMVNIS